MDIRLLCWVCARGGAGGEVFSAFMLREAAPPSKDCERRFDVAVSFRDDSALEFEVAQCCERIDRLSSIGVNILRDLTDMRLTGSSNCWCC